MEMRKFINSIKYYTYGQLNREIIPILENNPD